jgi:hypothetical protein
VLAGTFCKPQRNHLQEPVGQDFSENQLDQLSGFIGHASPSEPQRRASTLPAVSKQQRRQPTSTTTLPAIAGPSADINHKSLSASATNGDTAPTSKAAPQSPHNLSRVFTERVNKGAYHPQPSINCGPNATALRGQSRIHSLRIVLTREHFRNPYYMKLVIA